MSYEWDFSWNSLEELYWQPAYNLYAGGRISIAVDMILWTNTVEFLETFNLRIYVWITEILVTGLQKDLKDYHCF